jgi:hypothetical protein
VSTSQTLLAIEFQKGLSDAFTSVAKFVPKFVAFPPSAEF